MSAPSTQERYTFYRRDIQIVDGHGYPLYQCTIEGNTDPSDAIHPCIFPELSSCLFCPVATGSMPLTRPAPPQEYTKVTKKGS